MSTLTAALETASQRLASIAKNDCNGLTFYTLGNQADSLERIIDINDAVMRITHKLHAELVKILIDYSDASVKECADWYEPEGVVSYDGVEDVMAASWRVVDLFRESNREAAE